MSPITVAEATDTETIRRNADISHLSRDEPSLWNTLTSAVAHVTIEADVTIRAVAVSIGTHP
jgi:hypothetical protein